MVFSLLVATALAEPCASSLVVARAHGTAVTAAATSCWGAWGRDRLASQADIRSWLAWWESRWLGPPVEDAVGRLRYRAAGTYGLCGWSVEAGIDLREDHGLESALAIELSPWCARLVGPATERRVAELVAPLAAERRVGSLEPGAF